MDIVRKNLEHDSISHNGGYSKSKTKNLATKHRNNHNHNLKFKEHDKVMKIRVKSQESKEKIQTWIDCNDWSTMILEFNSQFDVRKVWTESRK